MNEHKTSSTAQPKALQIYGRLLGYLHPYRWAFALALLGNLFYAVSNAAFTYFLKPILDKGFVARDAHFIAWIPAMILLLFTIRGIANFVGNYYLTYVGRGIVMEFRRRVFVHLMGLPARFYDVHSSGQLLSTVIYNIEQLAVACTDALTRFVQSGLVIAGLYVVMLLASWQLTLLFTLLFPLIGIIVKITSQRMRALSNGIQDSIGDVTHIAEEAIEGYQVVRHFGGKAYEAARFYAAIKSNRDREMKLIVTRTLSASGVQMVAALGLALMMTLAMRPDSIFSLSPGDFVSLVAALIQMLKPMRDLSQVNSYIQKGIAAAQSIFEILDEPLERDSGTQQLAQARGHIQFQRVRFQYDTANSPALRDIEFEIKPGQTIALVGASGAGKSTLVKLLSRLYDVTNGRILLDGQDIRDYLLDSLRAQIAIVSQDIVLFNDTIANNIAYGSFDKADETTIRQAAEMAYADHFIEALPQQYDTVIGENGVLLSGGQRQRLAIARALLKAAPILILDEATAALDTRSTQKIQSAMDSLMKRSTTLVIAHRLATIENADRILVMDGGRIIEQGTHQELLQRNGQYATLHSGYETALAHASL